ncbi:MAG: tryptophan--tRNA ligase [Rickettsiales bacterium]|jgi:tryptophanyl-tRNA synthetase|nr:tryptophan--tRNA ligase [Rickettsiales bacterium]
MGNTILTGVKPTGSPHLGNLFGAIRPAIGLANANDGANFVFIADIHSLNSYKGAGFLREKTCEVAAAFLALGLNADRTAFYRQSDIAEVFELSAILANFCAKGLMNRAHAYKAALEKGGDAEVNMGLYTYPILMAADILAMGADIVPVGLDQKQHIEIARDIAASFNHATASMALKPPSAAIQKGVETISGLDGRKMSKSYGNTLEVFASAAETEKKVARIPTDSLPPSAPKPDDSALYRLMALFEVPGDFLRRYLDGGIGYGEAKKALSERINSALSAARGEYARIMADRGYIDKTLALGAQKARLAAAKTLSDVKRALGI